MLICLGILEGSMAQDSTIKVVEAFSLTEISVAFEQSEKELRLIEEEIGNPNDIKELFDEFHEVLLNSQILREDTLKESIKKMSLSTIRDKKTEWKEYEDKIKSIEEKTSKLNLSLEKQREHLELDKNRWELTREESKNRESTEVVHDRIVSIIGHFNEIDELRKDKQVKCYILLDSLTEE